MNYYDFLEGERTVSGLCNGCKKSSTFTKGGIFEIGVAANKIYALEFTQGISLQFLYSQLLETYVQK